MALKDKAKARSTANRTSSSTKRSTPSVGIQRPTDTVEEGAEPILPGGAFNQPPPLPPALSFIRKFATIPSLRKSEGL